MATKQPQPTIAWNNIKHWEELLCIKDLKSLVGLIRELKLDGKGLAKPEDFHKVLLDHWRKDRGEFSIQQDEIRNGLENGLKEQAKVRRDLYDRYKSAQKFYCDLDENIKRSLTKSFTDIKKAFEERKESLRTGECTIVVAGEVGSGKSSLINLLLGSQLFPTDPLKCTNTICEIRVSENGSKEAIVFYKTETLEDGRERTTPPEKIKLDSLKGIQYFKDCVTESNDDDESPYERVEVYWPFKMLSKGVVIVDSPGIEGGQNVDQRLTKYLSKAFGFIFMINTTTAGGVQPSRLGHLLKVIVNNANDFDPKASLFIGNKWEFVPEADRKDVKEDIFSKLTKLYPGIRPSQIHYMSVTKAMNVFSTHDARITEHNQLLSHIQELVPMCLRQGLSSNYWWLSSFLQRSNYLLRVFSNNFAYENKDLEQKRSSLKERVQLLRKNTDECISKLREKVNYNIYSITEEVKRCMKSKQFLDSLCDWRDRNECPKTQRKWKTTAYDCSIKISSRVTEILDSWEKEKKMIKGIEEEIMGVFARELGLMEDQLDVLEADLLKNKHKNLLETIRPAPVKKLFGKSKQKIKATYTTLGGAISVVGTLDFDKKDIKKVFKDYNDKNKCEKMAEGSVLYVKNILECKNLHEKLHKFFDKFFNVIDDAAQRIPSFLQADEQLIETINQQLLDTIHQREMLPELASICSEMLGSLDIYYVNWIMNYDYKIGGDIEIDYESTLGSGNFADVLKGYLKKNRKEVALKKNRDVVTKSNITDILTEDRIMRDLRHKNVIRYYGSAYKKVAKGIQWIMVMELCETSLKAVYVDDISGQAPTPGRIANGHPKRAVAVATMINHALQISEALEYIHGNGYTHRDMKLENVLLGVDKLVKITDVGISKKTNMLVRTCAGSPAYMAPEVLLSRENHTEKIDIYSTVFVFWEMWFGKDIVLDMNNIILESGEQSDAMALLKKKQGSDNGFRPDLKRANGPPESMAKMLQKGWDSNPIVRPEAKEFVKFFKELAKTNNQ